MTRDDAIHAAILAGFKRTNIGAAHVRLARIIETLVSDKLAEEHEREITSILANEVSK